MLFYPFKEGRKAYCRRLDSFSFLFERDFVVKFDIFSNKCALLYQIDRFAMEEQGMLFMFVCDFNLCAFLGDTSYMS